MRNLTPCPTPSTPIARRHRRTETRSSLDSGTVTVTRGSSRTYQARSQEPRRSASMLGSSKGTLARRDIRRSQGAITPIDVSA